ncbi:MAG: T9SS type A sorting domain-containing protein [Chlorobi bacterium]|nr:T9SS type A sorting domain-containing protein [Chlorobiota bacterium]
MKKITLLFLGVLLSTVAVSQSQRMVLAEECTSATCWPCGQQNPAFDALLQSNSDIITSIKYHVWWPAPGNDPMYLDNKADNANRTNYYGVTGVPHVMLDGTYFNGQPYQVTQSLINNAAAVPSPFEIQVYQELSPDEDTIYLTTLIHATDQVSGNLVAHVVVIEKHIHFNSPPGTNGEKDFYNVMKKLLPTQGGAQMPSSMEDGDYVILQDSWPVENVYDNNELAAVSFVQNHSTKEVFQAANSSTDPITPVYALDAEILDVMDVTEYNCSGSVTPTVVIRNNGSTDLTSFTLHYSVNDGEQQTYEWSGDLAFLETAEIQLSTLDFTVQDTSHLVISCDNPNGTTDDYPSNNTSSSAMYEASLISGNVVLALILDDHPEETTWEIYNSNGDVVQDGGPYDTPGQMIIPIELDYSDCYQFVIHDAGGNGTDYYALVYGGSNIIFEGSDFGSIERNEFQYTIVGIEETELISNINIFPNPATDKLNIDFYLSDYAPVNISITDMVGKVVYSEQIDQASPGPKQLEINTTNLLPGIYLLKVDAGGGSFVRKVSIR